MTDSPDFMAERVSVLQTQLRIALVESAELEAIVAKADEQLQHAAREGQMPRHVATSIRETLADSNGHQLKQREAGVRSQALVEAAGIVASIVDDTLMRADSDCADAARRAYDTALAQAYARLQNAATVASLDA